MTGRLISYTPTQDSPKTLPTIDPSLIALLNSEVLIETRPHSARGSTAIAQMYLPRSRSLVWQHITDYPRWVDYFPNITESQLLSHGSKDKQLYQAATKDFLLLAVQVEVYLRVFEIQQPGQQRVQFCMEKGHFVDFYADLKLQDCYDGTLLTYSVSATPGIPVPTALLQQAIRLDLPTNLRTMRSVICAASPTPPVLDR